MFGTVAKLRARPGKRDELVHHLETTLGDPVGYVTRVVFQMENDPDEFYVAGWFTSREAYFTHSDKPETHQTYVKMLELLEGEPEWHDGFVVIANSA